MFFQIFFTYSRTASLKPTESAFIIGSKMSPEKAYSVYYLTGSPRLWESDQTVSNSLCQAINPLMSSFSELAAGRKGPGRGSRLAGAGDWKLHLFPRPFLSGSAPISVLPSYCALSSLLPPAFPAHLAFLQAQYHWAMNRNCESVSQSKPSLNCSPRYFSTVTKLIN